MFLGMGNQDGGAAYTTIEADDSMAISLMSANGSSGETTGVVTIRWTYSGGITGNGWMVNGKGIMHDPNSIEATNDLVAQGVNTKADLRWLENNGAADCWDYNI